MDRMIGLIEGAKRQKTPNEIALSILLSALTIIFMAVVITMLPFGIFTQTYLGDSRRRYQSGLTRLAFSVTVLVSLLVCLIPTTIGGLLSAIGIAGIDRMVQKNVLAMSGRAVEAAGDVDVLLLDKTGTITLGNRQATEFIPAPGVDAKELAEAAQLCQPGRRNAGRPQHRGAGQGAIRHPRPGNPRDCRTPTFVPFTAQTRMSGVDINGQLDPQGRRRQRPPVGSAERFPRKSTRPSDRISRRGGTPLVVARQDKALGVIYLKDIVKGGLPDRFQRFRAMGIKTVMITGDNPLTAAAIAAEAGVDDFLAQATPEDKLALLRARAGRRAPGGHDRRRHQRRPRPGPGRRGRGHEHRHPGRQGGRQHGRSGLQPDQAHRGRRDRQADADDPRGPDHLQHRQRRGQVFRHHPGHADGRVSRRSPR